LASSAKSEAILIQMNGAAGRLRISRQCVAVFFGLLALAIQTLVVQTHVHIPAYARQTVSTRAYANTTDNQNPVDDPANCPLCREMLLDGNFLVAAVVSPAIPIVIDSAVGSFREMISGLVASHSWHGRAPPYA
jgi:hypothetical protein